MVGVHVRYEELPQLETEETELRRPVVVRPAYGVVVHDLSMPPIDASLDPDTDPTLQRGQSSDSVLRTSTPRPPARPRRGWGPTLLALVALLVIGGGAAAVVGGLGVLMVAGGAAAGFVLYTTPVIEVSLPSAAEVDANLVVMPDPGVIGPTKPLGSKLP
ncbi:MAG: hypothetical protein ABMA64_24065 [Myxococcota bacterium]